MQFKIELTQKEVEEMVVQRMQEKLGDVRFKRDNLHIEVKSKQNYRSEWEDAAFRAIYIGEA